MRKSTRMRQIIAQKGMLMLPGVNDALSAKVVEEAGFEALYMSGAMVSHSFGLPDLNILTMSEVVDRAASIAGAVKIPVLADADTGYGGSLNVIRTVREFERAGVAGIHMEDQIFPKRCAHYPGKTLISSEEMVAKIRAAADARSDPDFIIMARTDAATFMGIEEGIKRSRAYIEAGADAIFFILHKDPKVLEQAKTVCSSLSKPVMLDISVSRFHVPPLPGLEPAGVKIAMIPAAIIYTAVTAMRRAAREIKESGLEGLIRVMERTDSRESIQELVDLTASLELSEKYGEQGPNAPGAGSHQAK